MEQDDNNKILESDYELKGLYILSAPLLDEKKVVKFGMSECLQNRVKAYTPFFKTPYYLACYELPNEFTKSEIVAIEAEILNITLQYKTDDFTSEYRRIGFDILHNIVCNYLNKNEIIYTIFIRPMWKYFKKINSITENKHSCPKCRKGFPRKSTLDNHLKKKNKCESLKENSTQPLQIPQNVIKSSNIDLIVTITTTNIINCNYCEKSFSRKDAALRHMNQYCPILKQQNKGKQDMFDKLKFEKQQEEIIEKIRLLEDQTKIIITKNKQLEDGNVKLENKNKTLKKKLKNTINY